MKAFLDTNVLVAVFYGDHPHHPGSLALFTRYAKKEMGCGAHTLVELYASLTRMPGRHRISSQQAMLFVNEARERMTVVALAPSEYFEALESLAALGVVGGAIYDGMLAKCAIRAGAEKLFTWNTRHFEQFGAEIRQRLHLP